MRTVKLGFWAFIIAAIFLGVAVYFVLPGMKSIHGILKDPMDDYFIARRQKDYETAFKVIENLTLKQPENFYFLANLGVEYLRRGDSNKARSTWEHAAAVQKDDNISYLLSLTDADYGELAASDLYKFFYPPYYSAYGESEGKIARLGALLKSALKYNVYLSTAFFVSLIVAIVANLASLFSGVRLRTESDEKPSQPVRRVANVSFLIVGTSKFLGLIFTISTMLYSSIKMSHFIRDMLDKPNTLSQLIAGDSLFVAIACLLILFQVSVKVIIHSYKAGRDQRRLEST